MIVVDANVWLTALTDTSDVGQWCRTELTTDPQWLMPSHGPLEVLRVVGKLELAGALSHDAAEAFAHEVSQAPVRIAALDQTMLSHCWRMHHIVSVYDAPYLVLALRHGIPLVTCDQRLVRAGAANGVTTRSPTVRG